MKLPDFESEMMYQVVHIPSTMTLTAIIGIALNSIMFMLSLYCVVIRRYPRYTILASRPARETGL